MTCCSSCSWWLFKLGSIQVQVRSELPCHDWCHSMQMPFCHASKWNILGLSADQINYSLNDWIRSKYVWMQLKTQGTNWCNNIQYPNFWNVLVRMLATDKYPSATIRIHPTLSSWQMTSVATLPCVWGWSRWQPTLDRLPKKVDPGSLIVLLVWRETTTHLIPGLSGVDHYRGHCIRISSQLNSFLNFPKIPKSLMNVFLVSGLSWMTHSLFLLLIYALLSQNFAVTIYALFALFVRLKSWLFAFWKYASLLSSEWVP